jgi:hypothetical protein
MNEINIVNIKLKIKLFQLYSPLGKSFPFLNAFKMHFRKKCILNAF